MERIFSDLDPSAERRKQDHIELAFKAQVSTSALDARFYYEPMIHGLTAFDDLSVEWVGKRMKYPLWVSSMTGGTALAGHINRNLARVCNEFGLGMGLGSCRSLLTDKTHLKDFQLRPYLGSEVPFFANLGIAQVEELVALEQWGLLIQLLEELEVDGLIVHVNPLQEFLQEEGDRYIHPPIDTIEKLLLSEVGTKYPIIVKEVGQGMGPESIRRLLQLPLAAIDFAASGGTNFALLEILRKDPLVQSFLQPLSQVGHSMEQMLAFTTEIVEALGSNRKCNFIILSGGIQHFLDGFYAIQKSPLPSIYGQASGFLKHALGAYDSLRTYTLAQIEGLTIASQVLKVR